MVDGTLGKKGKVMSKVTDGLANNQEELEHGGNYKETCVSQD